MPLLPGHTNGPPAVVVVLGGVVWAIVVWAIIVVLGGVAGEVVNHDVTVTPWVVNLTVELVPDVGVAINNTRKFVEPTLQKLS